MLWQLDIKPTTHHGVLEPLKQQQPADDNQIASQNPHQLPRRPTSHQHTSPWSNHCKPTLGGSANCTGSPLNKARRYGCVSRLPCWHATSNFSLAEATGSPWTRTAALAPPLTTATNPSTPSHLQHHRTPPRLQQSRRRDLYAVWQAGSCPSPPPHPIFTSHRHPSHISYSYQCASLPMRQSAVTKSHPKENLVTKTASSSHKAS